MTAGPTREEVYDLFSLTEDERRACDMLIDAEEAHRIAIERYRRVVSPERASDVATALRLAFDEGPMMWSP